MTRPAGFPIVFTNFGLLVLRAGVGAMMAFGHGLDKLLNYQEYAAEFPDPLGVGSSISMALAVFAEFFCGCALILGLLTRLAVLPLIITMLVAGFIIHGADPWAKKELAFLYLLPFLTLLFTGPGAFSLDALLFRRKRTHNDHHELLAKNER